MEKWRDTDEGRSALVVFLDAHNIRQCLICGETMGWDNLRWSNDSTEAGTARTTVWIECSNHHQNAETASWWPGCNDRVEAAEVFVSDYWAFEGETA